jgi:methylated-DNA-[protein]-cysteine S-methyltransferase
MVAQLVSSATPVVHNSATALGHIAVAVQNGELHAVAFGHRSAGAAQASVRRRLLGAAGKNLASESQDDDALAADVLERLTRYAEGEPIDFSDIPVAVDHLTPFARRVVKFCRAIRRGQTRSYGELAAAAGRPGAARAVGQVMATNRVPLVVPCHRVVAADGRLGGFSAPDGLAMKRRLLDLEA